MATEDGTRVLYVDDDGQATDRVRGHLERERGVAVVAVDDADAALDRLDGVDCVVSAHRPPAIDGIALLDAVRERDPDLPFVLFTSEEGDEVAGAAAAPGPTRVVFRGEGDVRTAVLARRVRELTARREHERSLARLHEVATEIQAARTPSAVYDEVVDTALDTFGFDACAVRVAENGRLSLASGSDPPPSDAGELAVDRSTAGEAYRSGESRLVEGREALDDVRGEFGAALFVPLGDHGVVTAARTDPRGIAAADRELVELLASHATATLSRIERERQFQTSDARLRALSRAFPDYAFLYDGDGRYLDVLLGWEDEGGRLNTVEELVGQTVDEFLPEDSAEKVLEAIRTALETGDLQKTKYRVDTPGDPLWYEAYAAPLPDEIDDRETVILAARDVTARHRSRRELRRQNERLDQFASLVSHDLRNPLSVAEGYTQTAIEASDDETVRSLLEEVQYSHDRMKDLISDVLTLAREGRTVTETERVDLGAVAREAWENVDTAGATLSVETDAAVEADRSRLLRVFENCYRNAVEHGSTTPQHPAGDAVEHGSSNPKQEAGGETVAVTVGDVAGDARGFFVEDDGPGIPEDERAVVMNDGYTTSDDGTGLGLSIVRSIVEAHGWTVSVAESEAGGARFEVTGVGHVG